MPEAQGLQVVVSDDDPPKVRTDPVTGTVETDQDDGSVVVELDKRRPPKEDEEDKFYRNLADEIDQQTLARIALEVYDGINADDESRKQYLAIRRRGMDFLGLEIKEPRANVGDTSAAVEGMSVVTNPLLLEACLKGWANAQAELLPSDGPVKVEVEENIETQVDDDLAEALERDINHYLTTTATEYYPDTSHMLLWGVYFGGSGFKKIYRCPMRRRPVSESVDANDLIVSDTTKDLRSCARITHQISMRPSIFKRMQLIGAYRDVDVPQPTAQAPTEGQAAISQIQGTDPNKKRPEDQPYIVWESQCEIDLPEYAPGKFKNEAIPLPYLVTLDKESKQILAIRRDWREDDEDCQRKRLYVKYPYVPGPGFYGTGLLNILGNSSAAMTAAWRETLDAGMFANFPSGLIVKSAARQNTSDFRLAAGTFAPVEVPSGVPIGNMIMPTPFKDVTPGILALMDKITQQCAPLGGVADIPSAEGVANVPVGSMAMQVEQASKVMAAAHKGMHQAQGEEIRCIIELFREHPEDFWKNNTVCPPNYWNDQKFEQALNDCNLSPASDPNTPSHIHRVVKAVGIGQLFQIPIFAQIMDPREGLNRVLRALREDPEGLVLPPQPQQPAPPDPHLITAMANMKKADAAGQKAAADVSIAQTQNQTELQKVQGQKDIETVDLAKELIIHKGDQQREQQKTQLAAQQQQRDHSLGVAQHGLATQQAHHDAGMDMAEHALNVHEVMNPPQQNGTASAS
jgi:hypothetical protein